MKTFVTSDLHFNHKRILKFQPNRKEALNCETIEEMNENLIKHWNNIVSNEDTIYHLGDFAFSGARNFLPRLNGKKIFILGNHDNENWFKHSGKYTEETNSESRCIEIYNKPFGVTHQYLEIKYNGTDIVLFHFPIRYWNKSDHGALHFHGHTHGHYENFGKSIDVGFDVHNKILTMEEAIELANNKPLDSRIYE